MNKSLLIIFLMIAQCWSCVFAMKANHDKTLKDLGVIRTKSVFIVAQNKNNPNKNKQDIDYNAEHMFVEDDRIDNNMVDRNILKSILEILQEHSEKEQILVNFFSYMEMHNIQKGILELPNKIVQNTGDSHEKVKEILNMIETKITAYHIRDWCVIQKIDYNSDQNLLNDGLMIAIHTLNVEKIKSFITSKLIDQLNDHETSFILKSSLSAIQQKESKRALQSLLLAMNNHGSIEIINKYLKPFNWSYQ